MKNLLQHSRPADRRSADRRGKIRMRLLLAEDERSLSRAVTAILQKNNYSVDAVYDGISAFDSLMSGSYDGAILDIMMPGMDGLTVLRRIRSSGSRIPVLMLSAKSEIDDKVEGLDAGANDYLTKPFNSRELLARVRAMLRVNMTQTSSMLSFGNITLDAASYELSNGRESLRLTGKEYQMFEMLIASPGAVIPAEQFLEKIWGYDSDAGINTVWVYLSYLRKKLATLNADIEIRSKRGVGYLLQKK